MAILDPASTPGGLAANITTATPGMTGGGFGDAGAGSTAAYGSNTSANVDNGAMAVDITGGSHNVNVVDVLNDLLENTRDGEYGFMACAEEVETTSQLKSVFNERATQCRSAAFELVALISQYGGTPADGGTASGALHRAWVHTKAAVGANSPTSLLEECERSEDAALARYLKALKADLPADVRAVVGRQAEGAQRNHDQIKSLRDQARAAD